LQAAIAAVDNGAPSYAETDWPQIATLYAWLERLTPTPPIRLSRAVAVARRLLEEYEELWRGRVARMTALVTDDAKEKDK
jgi:hypothetical protein